MALSADQRRLLRRIVRPGRQIKDPVLRRKYRRAAAQTAIVESGISNPAGGDADSQGWRQERASLYPNPRNVRASAQRFKDEFLQQYDPGEKSFDVAAQVQRPAAQYRGRYREVAGQAREALREIRGGGSRGRGSRRGPGRVEAVEQFTPGVDNSEARRALLLQYLTDRGRPDALLNLAAGLQEAQDVPGSSSTRYVKVGGGKTKGGKLLVVGDSLAVGTSQFLKGAKTNAQVGRTSTASVADARKGLTSGKYGRVLLDFGSNDMSARELVRSVKKAQRLAPDSKIFVPEVKGGPDAAAKTRALRRIKGITVVPWSTPLGEDGVHPADYQARAREIRSAISGGKPRKAGGVRGGDILESFYNGPGGANTDEGKRVGRGFVSGHQDHVHVAARTHKEAVALAKVARDRFGLTVRELEPFDRVDPVHTTGSFHYSGRAADVSGPPEQMAAFSRWLARRVSR